MNKTYVGTLNDFAEQLGLSFDKNSMTIYGRYNGFMISLVPINQNSYNFTLTFTIKKQEQAPEVEVINNVVNESKNIRKANVEGYRVSYVISGGMTAKKAVANLQEVLDLITKFLSDNDFENCCSSCGKNEADLGFYNISGYAITMCKECYNQANEEFTINQNSQKEERVVIGLLGAFLGSLLGVVAIVILGQLGYVAALSGIIMAICSLKGYELLGRRLSRTGIIFSTIIMIFMVYIGVRLDWSFSIASFLGTDIFTAFQALPALFQEGYLESGPYYSTIAITYLFTVIGAAPTIIQVLRNQTVQTNNYKMEY